VDKRKQKKIKRAAAAFKKPNRPCPQCGKPGPHFVPPYFGEEGFWACESFQDFQEGLEAKLLEAGLVKTGDTGEIHVIAPRQDGAASG
jgi:hypothetical protein